jgi:hypothetical protein
VVKTGLGTKLILPLTLGKVPPLQMETNITPVFRVKAEQIKQQAQHLAQKHPMAAGTATVIHTVGKEVETEQQRTA